MPLTEPRRQQLDGIVMQMKQNNEPDNKIQFVVNDFKGKYENENAPQQQGLLKRATNFGKNVVKGAAESAVKTAVTGAAAVDDALNLAIGNTDAVSRTATGYNVPGFGQVKPLRIGQDIEVKKDANGKDIVQGGGFGRETLKTVATGAELASMIGGGSAAEQVIKGTGKMAAKAAIKQGLKEGVVLGATGGFGNAASKEDATPESVAGATLAGGAFGGMVGAFGGGIAARSKLRAEASKIPAVIAEKVPDKVDDVAHAILPEQVYQENKVIPFGKSATARAKEAERVTQKATKSGIDETVVNFVKASSPEDKQAFKQMFDMAEKGSKDLRFRQQPKQIAGKTILEGADHLVRVKDQGIMQTKRVLDTLDQRKQDASGILGQFLNDLEQKGVVTIRRGNGVQLVPMKGSKVVEEDLPFYQNILNKLMPDKQGRVQLSYRDMHGLRQYIFEKLNLAKSRNQSFSGDLEQYGEQLRRYLAEPINTASKGRYMASQQKTAEAMSALRDLVQTLGYKGNLENLGAKDLRVAEVASRIFGNAADRPMSTFQLLADTAKKYGYKPRGNYLDQLQFADILERYFGSKQTKNLENQVARGVSNVISEGVGTVKDAASMNVVALGQRALKYMLKQRDADQIKALKELLDIELRGIKRKTVFGRKK